MKTRNLVDTLCLIGQPLLLNAVSLPAMAYIIRCLGPTGYGQWVAGTSVTAFAFVLTLPGLRTLFVRRIAQNPDHAAEALGEQLGIRILLAMIASGAALLLCMLMHYPPVILYCVLLTSLSGTIVVIARAMSDVLEGLERFRNTTSVSLISGLFLTAVSVIAAQRGVGAVGMAAAYLSGPIATVTMLYAIVQVKLFPVRIVWSFRRYIELMQEVRVLAAQYFMSTAQDQVEQLIIPKLLGMTLFGYFSAGTMPASRLIVFPEGLSTSYFPRISGSIQSDRKLAIQLVSQYMMLSLAVCLPIAVLLVFLAGPLSAILFPKSAFICRDIIRITIFSLPLQGIVFPVIYSLQAAGKHSEAARANMWSTMCGCLLTMALIWRFGIPGACSSWIVRPAVMLLFMLPIFVKVYPEVIPRIPIRRICGSALLMGGFLWEITRIHVPAIAAATVGSCAAIVIYGSGLVLLRVVQASQLKQLLQR